MGFEKGKPKTGGRIAGTSNKVTADIKTKISALIDEQFDAISEDLELLEPKDRVTAYLKFLEYVLPKQRETRIDLSTLSDEQIDDLLNKALSKLDQA